MRFRTKLFIIWATVVLLVAVGSYLPIRGIIATGMDRVAMAAFYGTEKSLRTLQSQQLLQLSHAGELIMNIPELRSLIALRSSELDANNISSLQERLDNFAPLLGVQFICVLNGQGQLVAQNQQSPWTTLEDLRRYLSQSDSARTMLKGLYLNSAATTQQGLWLHAGTLYQVVGLPLVFQSEHDGQPPDIEGVLLLATPLTDAMAIDLAQSHQSQVSFVADGHVLASSFPAGLKDQLNSILARMPDGVNDWQFRLGGSTYRAALTPMVDRATGQVVARMLIQSSQDDALAQKSEILRRLICLGIAGLLVCAAASYLFSMRVTRPVQTLVEAARRVGRVDLSVEIQTRGKDELAELSRAFNDMVRQIRQRHELEKQVAKSRDLTIFAVAKLAESRDPETGAHLERVRNYSRLLAQDLANNGQFAGAIDEQFVHLIYLTSPLHDIGKVGIPDSVLLKPGKLNEREMEIMKSHTVIGAATLDAAARQFPNVQFLEMGRDIAAAQHERFDGCGYPRQLSGDKIPLAARIVAVADVYDALTTKRAYKSAYSHDAAKAIIEKGTGGHFDPRIAEAFFRCEHQFIEILQRYTETRAAA
jgi:response regulator RpfG family c-di-GMP phosphodiesterase